MVSGKSQYEIQKSVEVLQMDVSTQPVVVHFPTNNERMIDGKMGMIGGCETPEVVQPQGKVSRTSQHAFLEDGYVDHGQAKGFSDSECSCACEMMKAKRPPLHGSWGAWVDTALATEVDATGC